MWEHFKDQTFCHALRRRPDSLLLSAMRGFPPSDGGGVQGHRRTLFGILLQLRPPACMSQGSAMFPSL